MEKSLHNVADLPAATRSAVEALVGHPLRDSQKLYILALERIESPADEREQAGKNYRASSTKRMKTSVLPAFLPTKWNA